MTTEYQIITDTKNPLCGKTYEEVLKLVKEDGSLLKYVKTQTPEICLAAVKHCEISLGYIKEQTLEICIIALEQDTQVLQYIYPQFYKELGIELLATWYIRTRPWYKLFYYQGKYHAGCRGPWTAKEALEHWSEFHPNKDRAALFTKAIIAHQNKLNKSRS
jgi:hypothetical protein